MWQMPGAGLFMFKTNYQIQKSAWIKTFTGIMNQDKHNAQSLFSYCDKECKLCYLAKNSTIDTQILVIIRNALLMHCIQ